MQKKKWMVCFSGLGVLLLGSILLCGQFALFRRTHAQTAQGAASQVVRAGELSPGKVIVVSLSQQWMDVYQQGKEVENGPVTTGRPHLPTPTGTYHIFAKSSPLTFHSPWPRTSRYWYPPTKVQYAMEWRAGGYYLHDAWWHVTFGPGTNVKHTDPVGGVQYGSHGCIEVPPSAAKWLYHWAPIGTTVEVIR